MRSLTVFFAIGFALLLVGKALGVDPIERTATVRSVNFPPVIVETTNPTPTIAQYTYDAALTNIGIDAPRDDCIWEGDDLTIWAKVHNAGYEIVDCAEVAFTLDGVEFDRVHVAGLYPDEIRKYSATTVAPPGCQPYTVDAHIDWPPDQNPDNDDIEDIFATAEEADTVLRHDDGRHYSPWSWVPGYEYPDYASAAKYHMPFNGVVKYWEFYYANSASYPAGHLELFVWAGDPQTGYPIDDGTGGLYDCEFQYDRVDWPSTAYLCYPICMPVTEGESYFFGYSNRQWCLAFFCIDGCEDNPDWNWYKSGGVWYQGNLYPGDFWVHVYLDLPGVMMSCENLTPVFCRGKNFYFKLTVENFTGGNISGPMTFGGYAGYDCDPRNVLINLVRDRTYPPGVSETYYYFEVPNAAVPGEYSASVSGTLAGYDLFCCMDTDIIQCSPFRLGDNDSWELVEAVRPEVTLPIVTTLHQNYPNPFNGETNISYILAEAGHATLKIYDISGRLVATLVNEHHNAGEHTVTWDASSLSSGVYLFKLESGDFTAVRKMNFLK